MKRTVCLQFAFAILALSTVGCGGSRDTAESASRELPSGVVKVIRLDLEVDSVLDEHATKNARSSRLTPMLQRHQSVYSSLGHSDTEAYSKLLSEGNNRFAQSNQLTKEYFGGRDLTKEIQEYFVEFMEAMEAKTESPPLFYLAYGFEGGTNARTEVTDEGEKRILLNLNSLRKTGQFEIAVKHELVHFLKPGFGNTLLEICMNEGVASWISWVTRSGLDRRQGRPQSKYECLFWERASFVAAEELKSELINEFAKYKDETTPELLRQFIYLNQRPERIPNAPSRSGYFIGLLAVQAWTEMNPEKSLNELLRVPPDELWEALKLSENFD